MARKFTMDLTTCKPVWFDDCPSADQLAQAREQKGKKKKHAEEPACYSRCCGATVRQCLEDLAGRGGMSGGTG
jgi:hypothetical protein